MKIYLVGGALMLDYVQTARYRLRERGGWISQEPLAYSKRAASLLGRSFRVLEPCAPIALDWMDGTQQTACIGFFVLLSKVGMSSNVVTRHTEGAFVGAKYSQFS